MVALEVMPGVALSLILDAMTGSGGCLFDFISTGYYAGALGRGAKSGWDYHGARICEIR